MSEPRKWHWTWWRWQVDASADPTLGWRIYLYEQSEGTTEPESTLFYSWAIGAPGGVDLELGRVPRPIEIEYVYTHKPPNYGWTVNTAYGSWEVVCREGWPCGELTLDVSAARHGGHWATLWLRKIPAVVVVELSACLVLPPTEWHLQAGWMSKDEVERAEQAVAESPAK
jgi:hypothetical protein